MGSRPSKVAPVRSRSGLSFVSTSSIDSHSTIGSTYEPGMEGVKNFKFEDVTTKSFRVGWDPPNSFRAISYQVRLFPPDKIKSRTLLRAHPGHSHTFTKLNSATEYSVAVVAVNREGRKSSCETASVFTLPRPPRKLQFTSAFTSTSVKVMWKHCKGKPGFYSIEVTEDGLNIPTAQDHHLQENTKLFNNLTPGTEYIATVWNVVGGRKSEPISDQYMTAPRHVADVTFNDVTQDGMTLEWKKPEGKVHSYTLLFSEHKKTHRSFVKIENLAKTSYTFKNLVPGRLYKCKIVSNALQKNGKTLSSKSQLFTQCTVPQKVAAISTRDIGPEHALVTWLPGNGDADDYDLFLKPEEGVIGETKPRGINKTEYKFTGLLPGTIYTVGIAANSKDKSSKQEISSFATVPAAVPSLSFVKDKCSWNKIFCTWDHSVGGVENYQILYVNQEGKKTEVIVPSNQNKHLLTDLQPSTTYDVTVTALSNELQSFPVTMKQTTGPGPVNNLQATPLSKREIKASWISPAYGVEQYFLELKSLEENSNDIDTDYSTTECFHVFSDLTPGSLYQVSVTPVSNLICGKMSTTQTHTKPGDIQNVSIPEDEVTSDSIFIKWRGVEGNENNVDVILTRLKHGNDVETNFAPDVVAEKHNVRPQDGPNEVRFPGLEPNTTYGIRLRAVGKSGAGSDSVFTQTTKALSPITLETEKFSLMSTKTKMPSLTKVEISDVNDLSAPMKTLINDDKLPLKCEVEVIDPHSKYLSDKKINDPEESLGKNENLSSGETSNTNLMDAGRHTQMQENKKTPSIDADESLAIDQNLDASKNLLASVSKEKLPSEYEPKPFDKDTTSLVKTNQITGECKGDSSTTDVYNQIEYDKQNSVFQESDANRVKHNLGVDTQDLQVEEKE